MKHRKLMLIAIILVLATLTTNILAAGISASISDFIKSASGSWGSFVVIGLIIALLTIFISNFGTRLILSNPIVAGPGTNPAIASTVDSFLFLLIPLFILLMVLTGFYFLFSQAPQGRARAKSSFLKLFISMGAVLIALPLFQLLLDISNGIAEFIFSVGGDYVNIGSVFAATTIISSIISALFLPLPSGKLIAFVFLLFGLLTLFAVVLILVVRYLLVVLAAIIFPFTLVLWLSDLPYLKHVGANLMNHTITWIFVPVVTAAVVVIASIVAGGFYDSCSIPWITNANCWLSYFAGIASTFLILAAPLMMYGLMSWVGVTVLLFGWTIMAGPRTEYGGWGPANAFYYFPGADSLFRIPGVENAAGKVFGISPLYGSGGSGIAGFTTLTEGYSPGEIPMGAPPVYRGLRGIVQKIRGPSPEETMRTMPLRGPLAEGRSPTPELTARTKFYGREIKYKPFEKMEWYNPYHPRTVLGKLGPVGIVAAGGLLAGMGPAGIITAGLKGLWYEPGAAFPMEANVPVVEGGLLNTRTVTAPKNYVRGYNPDIVLTKAPNAFREHYPEEYNYLMQSPEGRARLVNAFRAGSANELTPPMAPPPQTPEAAAEEKAREKERDFIEVMQRVEGGYQSEMASARGRPELEGKVAEKYRKRLTGAMKDRIKEVKKIRQELKEARTYREHPVERGLREMQAPMEQVEVALGDMWPPFGQTARILSRQTNLMHGLKNLKVYSPTPPVMPDWARKKWEEEEKRRRDAAALK